MKKKKECKHSWIVISNGLNLEGANYTKVGCPSCGEIRMISSYGDLVVFDRPSGIWKSII